MSLLDENSQFNRFDILSIRAHFHKLNYEGILENKIEIDKDNCVPTVISRSSIDTKRPMTDAIVVQYLLKYENRMETFHICRDLFNVSTLNTQVYLIVPKLAPSYSPCNVQFGRLNMLCAINKYSVLRH